MDDWRRRAGAGAVRLLCMQTIIVRTGAFGGPCSGVIRVGRCVAAGVPSWSDRLISNSSVPQSQTRVGNAHGAARLRLVVCEKEIGRERRDRERETAGSLTRSGVEATGTGFCWAEAATAASLIQTRTGTGFSVR